MSSTRDAEEWVDKAPWNPQWFWPQAILFGFGAAGILAGLNYRRMGRPGLMWPTIVISSVAFIGVLAGLALAGIGYTATTAIIINAPAALILLLVQRSDYKTFNAHIHAGERGGLDLPVMIGLSWLVILFAFVVAIPVENAGDDLLKAEERITQGTDLFRKGEIQLAISNFDEAIRLAPQHGRAYYLRGLAYSGIDERERAIQDFDEAIMLDPQEASAYFSRGVAWDTLGEFHRAKSDYDEAIKLDSQNSAAYFNRAVVHTRLGMDREARQDAGRAEGLGHDPSLIESAINAARGER